MYKGELKGFPKEVVDWMVKQQVLQGNKPDVTVFEKDKEAIKNEGGFNWSNTEKGTDFCAKVIKYRHFNLIFDMYPKSEYPKVMMVGDSYPLTLKRVVYMEKCGKFISWHNAETLEGAEKICNSCGWQYAEDIKPENPLKQELLAKADELIQQAIELKAAAAKL